MKVTSITMELEMFVYLKKCFRWSGFLKFNGPFASAIAIFLRLFGIFISLYTIVTPILFVICVPDSALVEKAKSLQGAISLSYVLSIHVIFSFRSDAFFEMMQIIEDKAHKRMLKQL